jgi:hypothetical protein
VSELVVEIVEVKVGVAVDVKVGVLVDVDV